MNIKKKFYLVIVVICSFSLGYYIKDRKVPDQHQIDKNTEFSPSTTFLVMKNTVDETYEAVGTVRPRTETKIEAQVTGKILSINVKPGDFVKKGEKLIQLENNEYKTRFERAQQGLRSAEANREQVKKTIESANARFNKAESHYNRARQLFADNALSKSEMEQAESDFIQAEAELKQFKQGLQVAEASVNQAQKLVEEAKIAMDYTEIKATEDAEIARRLVEPGDLAVPGKTLLIVQTVGNMRLEAFVREGLINRIHPGLEMPVEISAVNKEVAGIVEEIVPSADPKTRSFLVKVGLPFLQELYPGMFGRLLIKAGTKQSIFVPAEAIVKVGQLESVMVKVKDEWEKFYVKTGKQSNGMIEIISGLDGGEVIGIPGDENA
ncbi:MAG: efflux RND transporter periplasmic adaptor subunit [Deltaproteobacteria bacterium]|nr:efflux RND transporter periplasmic adaptor subunit [Deltaproteobacteria bacterium]